MSRLLVLALLLGVLPALTASAQAPAPRNTYYVTNRTPLAPLPYTPLPLGAVRARGWLHEQLRLAAAGMTGRLDALYPEVVGPSNGWLGGDGDGWERGPYWIDGLLPLAYLLGDDTLKAKAQAWVEWSLTHQRADGSFGPVPFDVDPAPDPHNVVQRGMREDWWPKMVMLKVLQQYHGATGDPRVLRLMTEYFRFQLRTLPEKPLDHWTEWGRARGGDNLAVVYWLYNQTGEPFLLDLAELLFRQTEDWTGLFLSGDLLAKANTRDAQPWLRRHGVNLAMALKQPAVYYQHHPEERYLAAVRRALDDLDEFHGQPNGLFAADELLHGTGPGLGVELCSVVEMMYSLEQVLAVTGDLRYAERLEHIALNALPTQILPDHSGRQYYQQANQVDLTRGWRPFITRHGGTDICYGLLTGYPCCTTNLHQGWPKYVQSLWFATADDGLAALVYAPSEVTARVAGGATVRVREETAYPFEDTVRFVFSTQAPAAFPFVLRVPTWSDGAAVRVNGAAWGGAPEGGLLRLERTWREGDVVELALPARVAVRRGAHGVSVERGPLVYAMKVEAAWHDVAATDHYGAYREARPASPWQVGLLRADVDAPDAAWTLVRRSGALPAQPWSPDAAPLVLRARGVPLPPALMPAGVPQQPDVYRGDLPAAPAPGEITLIPYGCSQLRVSVFPVVHL